MKRLLTMTTLLTLLHISTLMAQLSGTFTIGTNGNYTTFVAAVTALNSQGVNGPVTFDVLNGTYSEQISITSIAGANATNTVTFQSQSGTASAVTLTSGTSPVVQIQDNADYLTFKNMTIEATNSSIGIVFDIFADANNVTISDCILKGVATSSTSFNLAVISLNISTNFTSDNISILNNTVSNGSYGVYYVGSTTNLSTGTVISGNTFTGQSSKAIDVRNNISPNISINQITGTNSSGGYRGIYLLNCTNNTQVIKNQLHMANGIGFRIDNSPSTTSARGLIANNFLLSDGTSTGNLIQFSNSQFFDVLYNSLLNTGNSSSCFAISDATTSDIVVKNNLFIQNASGGAIEIDNAGNLSSSDYNNLYSSGSTLGFIAGVGKSTLSDWRSASGTDANSVSTSVTFADAANGNLHLSGSSNGDLTLTGTSVSSVTDDIDGDTRTNSPYMGADEASTTLPVELLSFTYQATSTSVLLKWNTATETNNFGFAVYRSTRNSDWQKIGFVAGHGTTLQLQNYQFMDETVTSGSYSYRLKQIDTNGSFEFSGIISVTIGVPERFQLSQNYPNPFNPQTTIQYAIAEGGQVNLTVFNLLGGLVRELVSENQVAGEYSTAWDGRNTQGNLVSGGIYFYVLKVAKQTIARKRMIFIK